jgi:hypothetical protein
MKGNTQTMKSTKEKNMSGVRGGLESLASKQTANHPTTALTMALKKNKKTPHNMTTSIGPCLIEWCLCSVCTSVCTWQRTYLPSWRIHTLTPSNPLRALWMVQDLQVA